MVLLKKLDGERQGRIARVLTMWQGPKKGLPFFLRQSVSVRVNDAGGSALLPEEYVHAQRMCQYGRQYLDADPFRGFRRI